MYCIDSPIIVNITVVKEENVICNGFKNIPAESISGHFLIFPYNTFTKYNLYRDCFNYFMDESANSGYFAKNAEAAGAAGVLLYRLDRERLV